MAAGDTDAEGDDAGDNRASASSEDLIDQFSSNIKATLNKIDPDNKYSGYFPTFVTVLTVGVLLFGGYSYAKDISTTAALASNGIANGAGLTTAEMFDPMRFQPVCPASDGIYQFLKGLVNAAIGDENVAQFGPLIASVLLRVRLELCVFESFIYEAVVPFIRARGLSWVLPLHETAETFIAGSVFAVASNFILVGSTKIFAVLMIYTDALLGTLFRAIGWSLDRIPLGKPTTEAVGRGFALVGGLISNVRKTVEVFDTFVGRYLVFATSLYVIIKFVHFKFFNYLF